MDLGPDRLAIEEGQLLAPRRGLVDPRAELVHLVWLVRDGERAGLLEVAVDLVLARECDQGGQIGDAFLFEEPDLVGKVPDPVGQAVSQRRGAEATVPATRPEANGLLLE